MHTPRNRKSGFNSSITMKYWQRKDIQNLSEHQSLRYGLVNFKCLMTSHAMFDTQSEHVSASHVHAQMQATVNSEC